MPSAPLKCARTGVISFWKACPDSWIITISQYVQTIFYEDVILFLGKGDCNFHEEALKLARECVKKNYKGC